MMRVLGAGGLASRAMGSLVHVEQQGTENNDMRQLYFPSGHLRPLPWPQQDPQQQQPQQQLISYDSDGGWVRGGIDCGAGVPPPSGNGGDGGGKQRYIDGNGSSDGSSGGNSSGGNGDNGDSGVDIGGGDDGYTLVAGGSDPPPNWVVEEQQDGRNYAEDDSGSLAGTFGTSQGFSAARAAKKLASAAGSAGEICGERGVATHPFDPVPCFR